MFGIEIRKKNGKTVYLETRSVSIFLYRTHIRGYYFELCNAGMLQTGINLIVSHFLQPFLFSWISLYFCLSIHICSSFTSIKSRLYSISHFHSLYSLLLKGLICWCRNEYILINMYQPNGDLSCFTAIELKIANTVGMD